MLKDKFTIVVVPRRTAQVKKIKVPLLIILILLALTIGLICAWSFMVRDYVRMRSEIVNYDSVQTREKTQAAEIKTMSKRIDSMEDNFNNLEAMSLKLKHMMLQRTDTRDQADAEKQKDEAKKVEIAKKSSILNVIPENSAKIDSNLKYEQEIKFENLVKFFREKQNPFSRIPSMMPVKGYVIDEFGISYDPYTGENRPQQGIDIATQNFHPIYAPADGIVLFLETNETLGNVMTIDHGNGFVTRYGHISKFEVKEGDIVHRGKIIAQAGNTGQTTGHRFHYEVLFNGIPVNPEVTIPDKKDFVLY